MMTHEASLRMLSATEMVMACTPLGVVHMLPSTVVKLDKATDVERLRSFFTYATGGSVDSTALAVAFRHWVLATEPNPNDRERIKEDDAMAEIRGHLKLLETLARGLSQGDGLVNDAPP